MKTALSALFLSILFSQSHAYEAMIGDKDFSRANITNIHTGKKEIVLTFDDGPTPGVTNKVLDVLKNYNVKATFFVVGRNAQAHPGLMQRIVDEGHIVANHSMTHTALKNLSLFTWKKKVREEVYDAHAVMVPYMSNSRQFYYRAPEGAWDTKYAAYLNEDVLGKDYIGPVLWDIGGEIEVVNGEYRQAADWACWSKKISVDDCLSGYMYETRRYKGGVVLMHDLRSLSAELLEKYIIQVQEENYSFRTLDDVKWKL